MKKLSAPIYVLKRQAKELSRSDGIALNAALNHIAQKEGFKNWSLLVSQPRDAIEESEITSLPVPRSIRAEAIEIANATFEMALVRIEAENPAQTRALWNPEDYVDNHWLDDDILPIDRDYALSLIEAELWHHVIDLAVEADEITA